MYTQQSTMLIFDILMNLAEKNFCIFAKVKENQH